MQYNRDLSSYLTTRRKAMRWSQEELAERSRVSVRTIRNVERGVIKNPRQTSVDLLLAALRGASTHRSDDRQHENAWASAESPGAFAFLHDRAVVRDLMIGRVEALQVIRDAVHRNRCVVLTGPAGVGKTTLALRTAARLGADFPSGVTVVAAGRVPRAGHDLEHDVATLVRLLDEPEAGRTPGSSGLRLVIIDNAEHVVEPVASLAHRLLEHDPTVRLIITSRRSVPISTQFNWEVGPLQGDVGEEMSEAAELFLRCAQVSCPALDLTHRLPAVNELCAMLDNMPVAIELAANWLRSISLDMLLRSGPIVRLIRQPSGDGLPHQRTLEQSVRWSYELLDAQQRQLIHQLADLADGFTVEEVEGRVCRAGLGDCDVVGVLAELVNSSMVQVRRGPQYTYRMIGYVRELVKSWDMQSGQPNE